MDGVLIDACNLHKICLEEAMREELGYTISDEDHYNKFNGLPTRKKLKMLGISDNLIEKINNKKQKLTLSLIESEIQKDKSKVDLLIKLKNSKCKLACVTNSIKETTYKMLEQAGIKQYFDIIVTNEDIRNPKPDPEPYLFAIKSLNCSINKTIIIEDSEIGLKSAESSGARVIKVTNPSEVNINLLNKL